jgi:hypothetical protein
VPVFRYRSIEEMPRPWRDADDPANLRLVALLMALHRRLTGDSPRERGVQRFRSLADANAGGEDPFRREPTGRR